MLDPAIMLESKGLIKKNMDECVDIIANPTDRSIVLLAKIMYNTNSLLDALIEAMVQDQVDQASNNFTTSNPT